MIDQSYITNEDFVVCMICKKKLEKIDGRHTNRKHQLSLKEYQTRFPNSQIITQKRLDKDIINYKKIVQSKKEKEGYTKDVICCNPNCPREGKPFKGNINISNKYSTCEECKKNGYIHPIRKVIHQKQIEGMIQKFGVENPSKLQTIIKEKQNSIKKKQESNPNYYNNIKKKREKRNEEIYGKEWKSVFYEKSKDGIKKKYGVEHILQLPEFQEKARSTYKKITGYNHPSHNPKNQIIGDKNPMKRIEVKQKASESMKENWKDPNIREKRSKIFLTKFLKRLEKYLELYNIKLLEKYKHAHYIHKWKCEKCGYIFEQNWNAIQQGFQCPKCYPRKTPTTSKAQRQIEIFIEELGFNISTNDRFVIKPYELDIVIHSKKIAIEYNGLYFHQIEMIENTRKQLAVSSKQYHQMKLDMCEKQGYRLITIFEDEWLFKQELVKARLKYILNKNTSERIHGRKCKIREIESIDKNNFLENYHLQGKDSSNIKLGAFYNNKLVSVMTFSHGTIAKGVKNSNDKIWELNRFCSDYNYRIPGIASKLIEHFKRNYEWNTIFSYADLRWSNGNLYRKLNFKTNEKSTLNYWYIDINKCKRIHRFVLRKRSHEPKDIPEMILRGSEGYKVLWDCGQLKFVLEKK